MFPWIAACITSGNSVTCSLNAEWGKSDKVEITVPVVASASAQGTVVNQATVTDGNRTVTPQAPVNVTKPDPSGVSVFERFELFLKQVESR